MTILRDIEQFIQPEDEFARLIDKDIPVAMDQPRFIIIRTGLLVFLLNAEQVVVLFGR